MKKTSLLILFTLLISNAFSQCADTANIFTFTYNGKTYEVVKELHPWDSASACAVERGGYLVEIGDQAEQNAVYDAIINGAGVSPTYVIVGNGGGIAYVWTGATDQNVEGTWLWDGDNDNAGINFWNGEGAAGANNGAPVGGAYNNWGGASTGTPNEPDNWGSNQNYCGLALAGWPSGTTILGMAGEWNDIIGTSEIYYVIEYDSTTTGINSYKSQELNIYPNPSNGIINVEGNNIETIEIVDLSGRIMKFSKSSTNDVSELKKGFYFVKVKTRDNTITRKIIIE